MMKTIILSIITICATMFIASCGGSKSQSLATESNKADSVALLTVEELLDSAESLVGSPVLVQGLCTHACSHGAKRIFMAGSADSVSLRIEAGELGAFDRSCIKSQVKVWGVLHEQRIDEAYLQNWEAKVAAKTDERHGKGEAGCDSEKKSRGERGNTVAERIADFRKRIAEEKAATGREYLSFYYLVATKYEEVE